MDKCMGYYTQKELREDYILFAVYYAELDNLLGNMKHCYLNGHYGNRANIYFCDEYDVAVLMGFQPIGRKIKPDIYRPYEDLAKRINEADYSEDEKDFLKNILFEELVEEVVKRYRH